MKKILSVCLSVLVLNVSAEERIPKNIILFIGDGMGLSQVTAGKIAKGKLEMERCPVTGLVTTWSASSLVTDSAAAATALSTGTKTRNGALGMADDKPLKNVMEYAKEKNKSTGVAVVCALTHATPAGFIVHVPGRKMDTEIAQQIAGSDMDVLFGGGLDHFNPTNNPSLPELQKKMTVALTADEFRKIGTPEKAAALLYPVHPPYAAERTVSLEEMTQKALEILSQDKDGFFLMVEGSQIDWAAHKNNGTNVVSEVVDFDNAVGAGLNFSAENGETLVIITADHETGGFAVLGGSVKNKTVNKTGFVHGDHTASMVPLFASGPGSAVFSGIHDNTDIGKTMIRYIKGIE
ncbi:MAG TPA: alkaline phosphatase [Pontiellaceae bacterium]|nr:alkaline phosphatase [Pontiellaceae bacterium]HPR83540.1 alkaline phosphatase [Pontiellaceae bacterium]